MKTSTELSRTAGLWLTLRRLIKVPEFDVLKHMVHDVHMNLDGEVLGWEPTKADGLDIEQVRDVLKIMAEACDLSVLVVRRDGDRAYLAYADTEKEFKGEPVTHAQRKEIYGNVMMLEDALDAARKERQDGRESDRDA